MRVSFTGIHEKTVTFELSQTVAEQVKKGDCAAISGNGEVAICKKDQIPVGVVTSLSGTLAAVQVAGFMELPCDATITRGYLQFTMGNNGRITKSATGRAGVVVELTTDNCTILMI